MLGRLVRRCPASRQDLEQRVQERLAVDSVDRRCRSPDRTGRSGAHCRSTLPAATSHGAEALDVWGVNDIGFDASCTGGETSSASKPAPSRRRRCIVVDPTVPTHPRHQRRRPRPRRPPQRQPLRCRLPVTLSAQLVDGRLVLNGSVASDLERLALVQRAQGAVDPRNVVDQLTVDPAVGTFPPDRFEAFTSLMTAMPAHLVSGAVRVERRDSRPREHSSTKRTARSSWKLRSAQSASRRSWENDPQRHPEQAAALEAELQRCSSRPSRSSSTRAAPRSASASLATVQQVAGIAKRYAGVAIVRAGSYRQRGRPRPQPDAQRAAGGSCARRVGRAGRAVEQLTSQGFGLTQLIRRRGRQRDPRAESPCRSSAVTAT